MDNISYRKTRIFFKKAERAVYVSHLDLYRTFQRAFKRAKLPVWETEGFNKHIYLNFLLPLSLGITGVREPLDLKTDEEMTYDEIKNRLNETLPGGMEIIEVKEPVMKATEIKSAEYEIIGKFDCEKFRAFCERGEIMTEKRTKKKGITEIDIKPHISAKEISENRVILRIPAGSDFNLNPILVMDTFKKYEQTDFNNMRITRTGIFREDGEVFI